MIRMDPDYLQYVTKRLYPDIADVYQMSWPSVERAIRTSLITCWDRGNRDFLDQMVGYHLRDRPTVSEFFALSWLYLCRQEQENA
ncbi:sporulation initiation factor Spo0A C-terminal domain-containing protein [Oscillospiraceae bacterium NTUH-002-81]|nr:sporulation initiation factor Spo0A C-terminal domain-containing protein [Oscillospiraceae bacterium NTUH-002-81]